MPRDVIRQSFRDFAADGGAAVRRALDYQRPAGAALRALAESAWAITPDALRTMVGIASRTLQASPEAIERFRAERHEDAPVLQVFDGLAVVRITGSMFRHAGLFGAMSGATSYEALAKALGTAQQDRSIRGVLLDLDSPGGEVNGCQELVEILTAVRHSMPVRAHISGFGTSAAYWLASATERVTIAPTGVAGSIGVLATFLDDSAYLAERGLREITIVSSQSPRKALDPATDGGRAAVQRMLDDLADVFVRSVATHRGVTPDDVLSRFGQGDVFVGAAAVATGLVDAVTTFEAAFGDLREAVAARAGGLPPAVRPSAAADATVVAAPLPPAPAPMPQQLPDAPSAGPVAAAFAVDQRVRVRVAKPVTVDQGALGVVREIREGAHYAVVLDGQDAQYAYLTEEDLELAPDASPQDPPADAPPADPPPANDPPANAAAVERARVLEIQQLVPAGALRDACLADAQVTPAEAARRFLTAEASAGRAVLATLSSTEASLDAPAPATGAEASPDPDAARIAHIVSAHQRRASGRTR
jgi:capsid assembly protease